MTTTPRYQDQNDYIPEPFKDAGLTYRQVDHWCKRGYLQPIRRGKGSGYPRRWPPVEITIGLRIVELVEEGFRLEVAARRAREQAVA